MIDLSQKEIELKELSDKLENTAKAFNIEKCRQRVVELKKQQQEPGFWEDLKIAQSVNKEIRQNEKKIDRYEKDNLDILNIRTLVELCIDAGLTTEDDEKEIVDGLTKIYKEIENFEIDTLLKGEFDSNNAILNLHAGAGGTEAQDWAEMLYRMYTRYSERNGFKVEELDKLLGDEAGIKNITFAIKGENAYGYLKAEKGVHRLVRISPFDSNGRRHTSFASLEVMPEIQDDGEIVINDGDLKIDTYRSSGAGGQHVNKTESAIRITHLPTGIVVQCQNERSQIKNRETALVMLKSKLAELKERQILERDQDIKGDLKKIEWGSQIRSYVFCPYTLVKDHRTNFEKSDVNAVMDGDIDDFIREYLKRS